MEGLPEDRRLRAVEGLAPEVELDDVPELRHGGLDGLDADEAAQLCEELVDLYQLLSNFCKFCKV